MSRGLMCCAAAPRALCPNLQAAPMGCSGTGTTVMSCALVALGVVVAVFRVRGKEHRASPKSLEPVAKSSFCFGDSPSFVNIWWPGGGQS